MLESSTEKKFKKEVEKLGGWALKFIPLHLAGFPDRITLLPGGNVFFAELKQKGKPLRKLQVVVCSRLKRMGFTVDRVDEDNLTQTIEKYRDAIHSA